MDFWSAKWTTYLKNCIFIFFKCFNKDINYINNSLFSPFILAWIILQTTTSISLFQSLEIIMASTVSPSETLWRSSVFGGSIKSALAVVILKSRLLIWLPVLAATGTSSPGNHDSTTLWYSGLGSNCIVVVTCSKNKRTLKLKT